MFKWFKKRRPALEENVVAISAVSALQQISQVQPEISIADLTQRGNFLLREGKLDDAAACYRSAIAISDKDVDATINLAFILLKQREFDTAERYLRRAVEIDPRSVDGYYMLGSMYRDRDDLAAAIDYYSKAIEINHDFEIAVLDLCQTLLQNGQANRAKATLVEATTRFPDSVGVPYSLANIYLRENATALAIPLLQRVVAIECDHAGAHQNLAMALHMLGRLDEAIQHYLRVQELSPENLDALQGLGGAFHAQERFLEAESTYRKVSMHQPLNAEVFNNLGCVQRDQDKVEAAIESFRQAVSINPNLAAAHHNLGLAFRANGDLNAAAESHGKALAIRPDHAEAHHQLGVTLHQQGKRDAAIVCYRQAIALQPLLSDAHNNLGLVLTESGQFDAAVESHRQAISIEPNQAHSHNFLGIAFQESGRLEDAMLSYNNALLLDPAYPEAHCNLAGALELSCDLEDAIEHYRRALELKPDLMQAHCALIYTLSLRGEYSSDEYVAEAKRFGVKVTAVAIPFTKWTTRDSSNTNRPLNIGLVSGDLREHPVGFFLEGLLRHLNPGRIRVTAYFSGMKVDALTARIKPYFAKWEVLAGLDDATAARRIHDDGIDILIDLAGHTAHNRLSLFAWKPAPVQATWLGYWASTGVPAIDYLLADPVSAPDRIATQFTEAIWQLPATRFCFTQPNTDVPVSHSPVIRNGHVTFGCFQNTNKINDTVLALWAQIFSRLPDARLRLQSKQMGQASTREEMLRRLARFGIAKERVTLVGPMRRQDYLASHAEVDIILDTFPFPGGTTTCEALWMGVPTVTLNVSDSLISRQGASLLGCAGLNDWIANSPDDYLEKAVSFAGEPDQLNQLRVGLREQVRESPLFDAASFAVNFENALHAMWKHKCARIAQK